MNAPMNTKNTTLLKAAAVVGVAVIMGFGVAHAGIKGSKHDLGSGGNSQYSAAGAKRVAVAAAKQAAEAAKIAVTTVKSAADAATSVPAATQLATARTSAGLAVTAATSSDTASLTARTAVLSSQTESTASTAAAAAAAVSGATKASVLAAIAAIPDGTTSAAYTAANAAADAAAAATAAAGAATTAATTASTALTAAQTAATAAATAITTAKTDAQAAVTADATLTSLNSAITTLGTLGADASTAVTAATGTFSATPTTTTTEVCVFCHTPHGSDTSAAVPLWNKKLPSSGSYTTYSALNTSTFDSTQGSIGSVSLACLSCHDGSQAMDSMINAPGSGNYNAGGASAYGGAVMQGSPIPNLGTDLRNDHPISMAYAGGMASGAWSAGAAGSTTTTASTSFKDKDFTSAKGTTINGNSAWWVDVSGGTADQRDKTDMVLYTRKGSTGDAGLSSSSDTPYVECASCHDPHNAATASSTSVAFLRISNEGSAVCLACHNK